MLGPGSMNALCHFLSNIPKIFFTVKTLYSQQFLQPVLFYERAQAKRGE